ncbi:hypothetical protein Hanom_Chr09g00782491 [Helianthus anomalus]
MIVEISLLTGVSGSILRSPKFSSYRVLCHKMFGSCGSTTYVSWQLAIWVWFPGGAPKQNHEASVRPS